MNDYEQRIRGLGMYAPKNSKPYVDNTPETFIITDDILDITLKSKFDVSLEELTEMIEEHYQRDYYEIY